MELIPGLITDAGRIARAFAGRRNWFNVATLREPYRVEGKTTIATYHKLLATHFLEPEDETVRFFTGSGLPEVGKYSL